MPMNQYGLQVMEHWQKDRPQEYAQLEDPEAYFEQVGEEIAEEIDRRTLVLETSAPTTTGWLDNFGSLNEIGMSTEDEVLREYLILPDPEQEQVDPEQPG